MNKMNGPQLVTLLLMFFLLSLIFFSPVMQDCDKYEDYDIVINGTTGTAEMQLVEYCK